MNEHPPQAATPAVKFSTTSRAMWSTLDAAANPISMLVMLASLVRTLGAADYGVLAIALATSSITMAINPAIATTTTKFVSEATNLDRSGKQSIAGVITAALISVMVIDFVLVASTAIWRRPLAAWIFGDSMQHRETENILLLAMVAVGIQQIDGVTGAALRGLEQFRRQAIIELSMRGALAAFVTLVAWRTGSVLAVLAAQCLAYFLFTVLRLLALRKILPGRLLLARSSRQHVLLLFRYGSWMWLSAIAGVTYSSGDRIVIGRVLGSTAAGEYSIYVQLTQMVHFIPSSIFAFSLPAFSRLGASGRNHAEIRYSYRAYSVGINASALGIALALITCWHHVLKVFVSNDLLSAAPPLVVWILTANFLFLAVTAIAYYLLLALGKSRLVSLVTSSWMCVSLLLMVVLIPRYGLAGAAAARFVYALGTAQLLAKAHRFLRLV